MGDSILKIYITPLPDKIYKVVRRSGGKLVSAVIHLFAGLQWEVNYSADFISRAPFNSRLFAFSKEEDAIYFARVMFSNTGNDMELWSAIAYGDVISQLPAISFDIKEHMTWECFMRARYTSSERWAASSVSTPAIQLKQRMA